MVVKLEQRDALCDFLQERNIQSAVHFSPNHLYPVYAPYRSGQLPVTEAVWQRILTLPLYPHMGEANQDRVIEGVRRFAEGQRVDFAVPQHAVGG